jgi:hypothetical protein
MLDDADVAPVATVAKPVSTSPDKAAVAYLAASGCSPIFITETGGVATIRTGSKVDPRAVTTFWTMGDTKPVVACARRLAGKDQNIADAVETLKKAATECRVTLTPNDVVMARAASAADRLDRYMDALKGTGVLKQFTHTYRLRRKAAATKGDGFMSFATAELRFKRALIPLLMNGGKPAVGTSFFATIFDTAASLKRHT